ncbi:tetratricopeptide repeat protein [Noviherbaspirillum sp. CPCC 100848]|uniref:Tetratricopeptide repeat protein n=1 Tax=Noviherbaspirillum album TaxID=3080276 RepID=A0ABU6JA08_9BURK|nr:tetratricopeptide repeat protein [Noviherbaspirillum sp. CPCC 100848]MEC4720489.1 tetratricopeptide repeat protein [Noviherbaspirillum sp. CPCC 100848]
MHALSRGAVVLSFLAGVVVTPAMAEEKGLVADSMVHLFKSAKGGAETLRAWSAFKNGDKDAPAQIFALAKNGSAVAQNLAGYMLDNGEGVRQDSKMASAYFRAAAKENPIAHYNLAVLHMYGRGVQKDEKKAMEHYRVALEKGNVEQAAVRLALFHMKTGDRPAAWKFANEAANRGNYMGFYLVGRLLFEDRKYQEAFNWLSKAAGASEPNSPALLSKAYADGLGLDRNSVMAGGWWLIYLHQNRGERNFSASSLSGFGLDEDGIRKATRFATDWIATHRRQDKVAFDKTIYEVKSFAM